MISPIYKISDHDIVRLGRLFADLQKIEDVEELSMNITNNDDGSVYGLDIGLLKKDFYDFFTKLFDYGLRGELTLSDLLKELIYIKCHLYVIII